MWKEDEVLVGFKLFCRNKSDFLWGPAFAMTLGSDVFGPLKAFDYRFSMCCLALQGSKHSKPNPD